MPDITLHFDGTTEARGRNGWFTVHTCQLWRGPLEGRLYVDFYSKHVGRQSPICLMFQNPDELKTLICGLSKVYAQMLTCREEESIREV